MNRRLPSLAWLPYVLLGACLLYVVSQVLPPREGAYQLSAFGRLPVQDLGRVKPIDTLARTSLMVLSNRQVFWLAGDKGTSDFQKLDGHKKTRAIQWLLDVVAQPAKARGYQVIRIDHPEVLALLGASDKQKYFSLDEVMKHQDELVRQFDLTQKVERDEWTPFQRQLMTLNTKLSLYFALEDAERLRFIPPPEGVADWTTIRAVGTKSGVSEEAAHYAHTLTDALVAWQDQDPAKFNTAVGSVAGLAGKLSSTARGRLNHEWDFNQSTPFMMAMSLYVLVFVLAALSWLRVEKPLARSALWILSLALVIHTIGLISRIYIQGRPPVTNLYSSAIFVGWGGAVLGLILERIYRNGVGSVTASGLGFLTLLVAHNLSMDGDTMTMMQAVLDTNFWLATHVVVITLGYGATFLAGFLAIVYIMRGVFTRGLTREMASSLSRMIYGIIAFATLFSFVGTILGGIWADQSWGRFWGWDPKENGALLIVLWNALVLHARWGRLIGDRGTAVLGVAGNIVTSWSWFGTNMLGVGLHAYGFIDSALFWMFVFVTSQLAIIGIGLIPLEKWRSPLAGPATPAVPKGASVVGS